MRLNSDHHEIILNFAETNSQIITNRWVGLGSYQEVKQLWDQLTTQLNSLGYGTLTMNEYKRRLTDWKSKTKAKASEIKKSICKTGGGPTSEITLSNHEKRLLTLMGSKSYEGDSVAELGVKNVPIFNKKCQQNQNFLTQVKRKFEISPLKGPIFSTPVLQPLFPSGKNLYTQTSSPPQKKTMYNFQEEFEVIEGVDSVVDEIEVSSEVPKIVDATDYIENQQAQEGNYSNQEPSQEHNYADITLEETKSSKSRPKPSTSTRRRNKVLNVSKDIQNMNNETLCVLKDINSNLTRIGDNISKLTDAICLIAEKK